MKFILGKKLGMSQVWKNDKLTPITLIEAGPCEITQLKTKKKDRYEAVQIGFERIKKEVKKTMRKKPFRYLREFRMLQKEGEFKTGDKIDASIFKEGDKVKVSGISKGKGFQGGVKRWGFSGKSATHGVKHEHRTIGSVGSSFPERVIKGKKMPGRMGNKRITIKNLKIIKINPENNLLAIGGAIPGRKGTLLEVRG